MIRLDEKEKLISDCLRIFALVYKKGGTPNSKDGVLPSKRLRKIVLKSICSDLSKGLKIINKKNPLFVEMPDLKKEGNGMYSEQYQNVSDTIEKEIIVTTPVVTEIHPVKRE